MNKHTYASIFSAKSMIGAIQIYTSEFYSSIARVVFNRSGWRRNRESAPNSVSCAGRNQPPDGQGPRFWYCVGIGCHQESDLLPVVRTLTDDLAHVVDPGGLDCSSHFCRQQAEEGLDRSIAVEEAVAHGLVVVVQRRGDDPGSAWEPL